jgi:hypothetical protein
MTGTALVTSIIEILVSGITGIASGVGEGLSTLASGIFFTTTGETTELSVLGICIIAFAAISLGLSLCRWVVNFFTSLGSRNR